MHMRASLQYRRAARRGQACGKVARLEHHLRHSFVRARAHLLLPKLSVRIPEERVPVVCEFAAVEDAVIRLVPCAQQVVWSDVAALEHLMCEPSEGRHIPDDLV